VSNDAVTVAVAESCTGGLVMARVVAIPGSGDWFLGGVVAYDAEVKFDVLGVRRGPVISASAAQEMAAGVRRLLNADIGVATTGVAGPETEEDRPVGTVFVGLAGDGDAFASEHHLDGPPDRVRSRAAELAISKIIEARS
jgi:PncC family amidohydrolase